MKKIFSANPACFCSLAFFTLLFSCGKNKPVACFTNTTDSYHQSPGMPIQFENCSENSDEYIWDFGDSTSTSTEANPVHIYANNAPRVNLVTLFSKNGRKLDAQYQYVRLNYPVFKKLRILSLPKIVPGGSAWYPDSANTYLRFELYYYDLQTIVGTFQPTWPSEWNIYMERPDIRAWDYYHFEVEPVWGAWLWVSKAGGTNFQTMFSTPLSYDTLAANPVYLIQVGDSIKVELEMEMP